MLPPSSPEPGQWRSSRNPYMVPIVRAFVKWYVDEVTFMMATQMGKSASIFNVIGHRLDDDPAPIIYIGPTQSNIDNVIEPKVKEMLLATPSLARKTAGGHSDRKHSKLVNGVPLRFAWAGSPAELASDSAAIAFVDEYDRMLNNVKGEGDPLELAENRVGMYPDGTVASTSTPTEGHTEALEDERTGMLHWEPSDQVVSAIWARWQLGSRHEWAWPCPECWVFFVPRFQHVKWPKGSTPAGAERDAYLECPNCRAELGSDRKSWMNAHGAMCAPGQRPHLYEGESGEPSDTHYCLEDHTDGTETEVEFGEFKMPAGGGRHASFWVSGLASLSAKKTVGYLARKWLKAVRSGSDEQVTTVVNAQLGELFRVAGEAPKWKEVQACVRDYPPGLPVEAAQLYTVGVDVQKNMLVYVVRGWAPMFTSWLVAAGEIWGDTKDELTWLKLDRLVTQDLPEAGIEVSRVGVDSGYRTDEVYAFCRTRPWALPTKGHDQLDKPYYASKVDVNVAGRAVKVSLQLWHFDGDVAKSFVHNRVRWPADQPSGGWFLHSETSEDYCKQIVAEQRVVKPSGKVTWVVASRRNHYLDAEAICYVMVRVLGVVRRIVSPGVGDASQSAASPGARPAVQRLSRPL